MTFSSLSCRVCLIILELSFPSIIPRSRIQKSYRLPLGQAFLLQNVRSRLTTISGYMILKIRRSTFSNYKKFVKWRIFRLQSGECAGRAADKLVQSLVANVVSAIGRVTVVLNHATSFFFFFSTPGRAPSFPDSCTHAPILWAADCCCCCCLRTCILWTICSTGTQRHIKCCTLNSFLPFPFSNLKTSHDGRSCSLSNIYQFKSFEIHWSSNLV